jgi:hypothetical protein
VYSVRRLGVILAVPFFAIDRESAALPSVFVDFDGFGLSTAFNISLPQPDRYGFAERGATGQCLRQVPQRPKIPEYLVRRAGSRIDSRNLIVDCVRETNPS